MDIANVWIVLIDPKSPKFIHVGKGRKGNQPMQYVRNEDCYAIRWLCAVILWGAGAHDDSVS